METFRLQRLSYTADYVFRPSAQSSIVCSARDSDGRPWWEGNNPEATFCSTQSGYIATRNSGAISRTRGGGKRERERKREHPLPHACLRLHRREKRAWEVGSNRARPAVGRGPAPARPQRPQQRADELTSRFATAGTQTPERATGADYLLNMRGMVDSGPSSQRRIASTPPPPPSNVTSSRLSFFSLSILPLTTSPLTRHSKPGSWTLS